MTDNKTINRYQRVVCSRDEDCKFCTEEAIDKLYELYGLPRSANLTLRCLPCITKYWDAYYAGQ